MSISIILSAPRLDLTRMLELLDGADSVDLVKGFEMKEEKTMLMDVVGLTIKN